MTTSARPPVPSSSQSSTPVSGTRPAALAAVVLLVGLLVTLAVSWASWTLNQHNEKRLLEVQTRQAAALVASSVLTLTDPLRTTLRVADATRGDAGWFKDSASPLVGPSAAFAAVSLWQVDGATPRVTAAVGKAPGLQPGSAAARAFIALAAHSKTFVVTSIGNGAVARVGYAVSDRSDPTFVVYAERAIPANRQVEVESDSAFSDLHFATYLGAIKPSNLATTDLPPSSLPLTGSTARESIPFGNTSITLVAAAKGPLGGGLVRAVPWILLVGGAGISIGAAAVAYQLARRRRIAESDALTITGLYSTLDGLYGEQRSIAYTLQQALLPAYNPSIRNLEIASRYVAGAEGVDIGGDWYSIIALDQQHFGFVVGDVSGRGVSAATIMARLRYTMRAYLLEGHPPEVVLEMCSRQLDLDVDGHFATVLVGMGDVDTRTVVVANAGHFSPLILSAGTATYAETKVGLPIGIEPGSYDPTIIAMPQGSTLLAFTDGLVERRGESLDVGLERLAMAATRPEPSLDALLTHVISELTGERAEDDVAILAFRWTPPSDN
jgi:serine phosphatase RsbU (regulator of sigma subunit)